jgi:hypothetical protein
MKSVVVQNFAEDGMKHFVSTGEIPTPGTKHFLFYCDQISKVGDKAAINRETTLLQIADRFVRQHDNSPSLLQQDPPVARRSLFEGVEKTQGIRPFLVACAVVPQTDTVQQQSSDNYIT